MLKEQKSDPFTGVGSKDYKGKGQVSTTLFPLRRTAKRKADFDLFCNPRSPSKRPFSFIH